MIKIMITKPKKTPDHLVMIIQLMNIFMTCKDCIGEYILQLHARCRVLTNGKSTMVKELERGLVNSLYGALPIVCEKEGRKLITGINDVT